MNKATQTSDEWAILAALRFVLAAIVLWSHLPMCTMLSVPIAHWCGPQSAVMGFFLLSGYSIASSLGKEPNAKSFYARRALRILPLLWVSVGLALIAIRITHGSYNEWYGEYAQFIDWPSFIANVLFWNGIVCETCLYIAPLWSLSIEVWYYAFAPLISKTNTTVLAWVIGLSSVAFVWHSYAERPAFGHETSFVAHGSLLCFWLLGFILHRHRDNLTVRLAVLWLPSVLMSAVNVGDGPGGLLTIQACTLLLVFAPQIQFPALLKRTLSYLGDVSYPLYILHVPILIMLGTFLSKSMPTWETCSIAIGTSLTVAVVLLHAVDYPMRKLRFRLLSREQSDYNGMLLDMRQSQRASSGVAIEGARGIVIQPSDPTG